VVDISDPEPDPELPLSQVLSPNITKRKGRTRKNQIPPPSALAPSPVFPIFDEEREVNVLEGRTTKKIVLRESLEGCWEFADDTWGMDRKGWEQVEVVDLTEN
jgi:hypothetical protein